MSQVYDEIIANLKKRVRSLEEDSKEVERELDAAGLRRSRFGIIKKEDYGLLVLRTGTSGLPEDPFK